MMGEGEKGGGGGERKMEVGGGERMMGEGEKGGEGEEDGREGRGLRSLPLWARWSPPSRAPWP